MFCKILISLLLLGICLVWARYDSDRVLLRDISAITLYSNQMTTGRRSSPVPQLKCIGGSAGHAFKPQVVQCKNVGFDGYDVQWECKTDMDDSYRFGRIQVSCEGYDYPDDPYILKGSCGLEYSLDYTEAGRARDHGQSWNFGSHHGATWKSNESCGSWFIFFIIVFAVVFLICKMSSRNAGENAGPQRRTPSAPYPDHHGPRHGDTNPPPYGFKPDYGAGQTPSEPPPSYENTTGTHTRTHTETTTQSQSSPFGGFWSGLGLGGLGGYLFGRRGNNYQRPYGSGWGGNTGWGWGGNRGYGWGYGNGGYNNNRGWSWGNSWGSSGGATYRRNHSNPSAGTTRTASGFGGTSRR